MTTTGGRWRQHPSAEALKAMADLGLELDPTPIQPGDLYFGEHNTGPQLLTCKKIDERLGCIFPVEMAYPYDLHECTKVREVSPLPDTERSEP